MRRYTRRSFIGQHEAPAPTFMGALTSAYDRVMARARSLGRTEFNDEDTALAVKLLCKSLRAMPPPYPELADRMESQNAKSRE